MLSIPRALPPVTHGSALQAPKRIEVLYDATSLLTGRMPHKRSAAWRAVPS